MATGIGRKRDADIAKDDALPFDLDKIDLRKVPPYGPKSEQAPRSVTMTKEWQVLEEGRGLIVGLVVGPFTRSEHHTKVTDELVERTQRDLLDPKREDIVVCISGNMGGGKSATLNSLFENGSVAREGDSGSSCTLASNRFTKAQSEQKSPYLAEVFLFPVAERREILAGYLRDYFRASHGTGDEEDGSGQANTNPAIKDEVAGVLVALFKEYPQCRSKKEARHFLDGADSEDDLEILVKLFDWDEKLVKRTTGGGAKTITLTASTPGELIAQLDGFATEVVDEDDGCTGASMWPFVSLIEFRFHDPTTSLGITFLDTPGLSDHNQTRRRSANKYCKTKTHSIIVSDAARAKDDPMVANEAKLMSQRGPDRVVIVLPKSDIIGDATMPPGTRKDKQKAKELRNQCQAAVKAAEQCEERMAKCEEEGDEDQAMVLNKQKRKLDVWVKYTDNREKAHRIRMRSESSKETIREKLQDLTHTTRPTPVFAVSNKLYNQHLAGFSPKDTPVLSVDETAIPDLRRLISTFPNEARLNEARHHQITVIPSLLKRFALYTARTPLERKSDMEKYVLRPLVKYEEIIKGAIDPFAMALKERIVDPLRTEESSWIQSARALCERWEDANKTTPFLQLINRDGHRRGGKSGAVNMSGDLIALRSKKISGLFERAVQYHNSFEKSMLEELDDLAADMLTDLREDPNYGFVDLEPFLDYINTEKTRIPHAVRQSCQRILEGLENIQRKATLIDEDAYVVEAMAPVYKDVALLKAGKGPNKLPRPKCGWPQHRKNTFKQQVTRIDGIWAMVYTGVQSDVVALLQTEQAALNHSVGAVFKDFQSGFDMMCDTKVVSDPKEKALQEELKVNLKQAEQHLNGPMRKAFDALWKEFH
ncbi:Putative P-loop containing nucleoside triphosphate hydrolase [Septoria linicola]|uniref:P-loop containing nucleoside triphosphate hydrolase n=1 Tax=Septoria linicola TaxID=215465 RepID=A0A9Q9AP32_9PEZI|nr:Putative P-loop containing nucleoside triphosphate hydrolase [Septoria linicola]